MAQGPLVIEFRDVKKCIVSGESLDFWWSILDHFGPCLGFPAPSKSEGFAPRPCRERQAWVLDRFF